MANVVVYYHDPVEVDPSTSWTGLCPALNDSRQIKISTVANPQITNLFQYTRPNVVIAVDEKPILSIEQSQMNPSGHNIPQRFSFHVRAAELGVPSILYYPEYSRRTFSDTNVRYVQIRVPMAQLRLSNLYGVPALSIFWPTNPQTLLPDTRRSAHTDMAGIVNSIVTNALNSGNFLNITEVKSALAKMKQVISKYAVRYDRNPSVRKLLPDGFPTAATEDGITIDPPGKAKLFTTE